MSWLVSVETPGQGEHDPCAKIWNAAMASDDARLLLSQGDSKEACQAIRRGFRREVTTRASMLWRLACRGYPCANSST